jgi:hypothetical protein
MTSALDFNPWRPANADELLLSQRPQLVDLARGALAHDRTGKTHILAVVAYESPWRCLLDRLIPPSLDLWSPLLARGYPAGCLLAPKSDLLPVLRRRKPRAMALGLAAAIYPDPGPGRFHVLVLHHAHASVGQVVIHAKAGN